MSIHSSLVKDFLPVFSSSISTWGIWIGVSLRIWMGYYFLGIHWDTSLCIQSLTNDTYQGVHN